MYHIAWEVPTLHELEEMRDRLAATRARWSAPATTAPTRACTPSDPDGLEFEVMWLVPAEHWGEAEHEAIIEPLDIDAESRKLRRRWASR